MGQAILSVHMDEETQRAFADFCEQIGMSVSTAITARRALRYCPSKPYEHRGIQREGAISDGKARRCGVGTCDR